MYADCFHWNIDNFREFYFHFKAKEFSHKESIVLLIMGGAKFNNYSLHSYPFQIYACNGAL